MSALPRGEALPGRLIRDRINPQSSHPAKHPNPNPAIVRRDNTKVTSPPKKPFIEPMIPPRMPKESAVPKTITTNKFFSWADLSFTKVLHYLHTDQANVIREAAAF